MTAQARRPNRYLSLIVWLLPACGLKNRLLNLIGNQIAPDAVLAPSVVIGCGAFTIGDRSGIAMGNVFRNLSAVVMDSDAQIGSFSMISASPVYQQFDDRAGQLRVGRLAFITNRHSLDCSGQIEVREGGAIAGVRSVFQSHELDVEANRTTIGSIVVGSRSLVGASAVVLKNARIPDRSLVAAGSTVTAHRDDDAMRPGLYAGSPARWRRELTRTEWMDRDSLHTHPASAEDFDFDNSW